MQSIALLCPLDILSVGRPRHHHHRAFQAGRHDTHNFARIPIVIATTSVFTFRSTADNVLADCKYMRLFQGVVLKYVLRAVYVLVSFSV